MTPDRLKFLKDTGSKEIRELALEIERLQAPLPEDLAWLNRIETSVSPANFDRLTATIRTIHAENIYMHSANTRLRAALAKERERVKFLERYDPAKRYTLGKPLKEINAVASDKAKLEEKPCKS